MVGLDSNESIYEQNDDLFKWKQLSDLCPNIIFKQIRGNKRHHAEAYIHNFYPMHRPIRNGYNVWNECQTPCHGEMVRRKCCSMATIY